MPDVLQFLRRLHRSGKWAYLWTTEGARAAWYPVGRALPSLSSEARNIYYGVHPTNEIPPTNARGEPVPTSAVRARKRTVSAVNCLFSEFDAHGPGYDKRALLSRIAGLDPPPSVVVDSGGGYHCYWLLEEIYEFEDEQERRWIDGVQKSWVPYTGGDDGAKDLARMLRLPGTQNHNYEPPRPVRWIAYDLWRVYALSELERDLPHETLRRSRKRGHNRAEPRQPGLALVAKAAEWLDRLAPWRCDAYRPWIEVGMALSELGGVGFALWDLWSQKSAKYEPGVCREKWKTFVPGEGLTLGSLRYWANEDDPQPKPADGRPPGVESMDVHIADLDSGCYTMVRESTVHFGQ